MLELITIREYIPSAFEKDDISINVNMIESIQKLSFTNISGIKVVYYKVETLKETYFTMTDVFSLLKAKWRDKQIDSILDDE